jgi:hypothetical protein
MGSMMSAYGRGPLAGMMRGYLGSRERSERRTEANPPAGYGMGPGMMGYGFGSGASGSGGWPIAAVVAVAVLGALLLGGVLAVTQPKLRHRGGTSPATRRTVGS